MLSGKLWLASAVMLRFRLSRASGWYAVASSGILQYFQVCWGDETNSNLVEALFTLPKRL